MRQLLTTFVILLVLMVLTVAAAVLPYWMPSVFGWMASEALPIRLVTNFIALGIALVKAAYVVQVFMGVKFSTRVVKFYAYGGFIWFITVFVILVDYFSRPWEPVQGWEKLPPSALPRDPGRLEGQDKNFVIPRPEKKEGEGGH